MLKYPFGKGLSMRIVIKPKGKIQLLEIAEIFRYRELFYIFSWRDIKVRYKQTLLGVSWALFQPLISMIIFTFFFGNLAKVPSGNLPYALFVLIGLIFWTFFSGALTHASNSLIESENLIKKVYFPRLILPFSSVITALIDFLITLFLLFVVMIFFRASLSIELVLMLLIGIFMTFFSALGLGLLLCSLNVKYRDVRYILPFFIQLLLFLSPVIYPVSSIKSALKYVLALNPMTGVIESVRAAASYSPLPYDLLLISAFSTVIICLIGLIYFRSTESFFADIV